jgi:peptidoglycan/xylan/chitin deacetylase (PgdA/CDA1 family)
LNDTLVLGYHAVSDGWPSSLAVPPRAVEDQVRYLLQRGYRGVTFDEAVHGGSGGRLFAVTFDDAYRSVERNALPLLSRLGVPGTVFAPTAYIGSEEPMGWPGIDGWLDGPHASELVPMSWPELAELAEAGWEIGSHTRTHPRLTELEDEAMGDELRGSREECERRLGRPCRSLAYPYGAHDRRVIEAARRAGYSAACTLPARLHAASPLRWPRVGIYLVDAKRWRFKAKVSPAARALRTTYLWTLPSTIRAVLTALRPGSPGAPTA